MLLANITSKKPEFLAETNLKNCNNKIEEKARTEIEKIKME